MQARRATLVLVRGGDPDAAMVMGTGSRPDAVKRVLPRNVQTALGHSNVFVEGCTTEVVDFVRLSAFDTHITVFERMSARHDFYGINLRRPSPISALAPLAESMYQWVPRIRAYARLL